MKYLGNTNNKKNLKDIKNKVEKAIKNLKPKLSDMKESFKDFLRGSGSGPPIAQA
jgi:hypothetical protein